MLYPNPGFESGHLCGSDESLAALSSSGPCFIFLVLFYEVGMGQQYALIPTVSCGIQCEVLKAPVMKW